MFPTPADPMTCPAALYHLLVWLKPSCLQAPERAQRSLLAHCSIETRVASESLPPPSPELEGVSQQSPSQGLTGPQLSGRPRGSPEPAEVGRHCPASHPLPGSPAPAGPGLQPGSWGARSWGRGQEGQHGGVCSSSAETTPGCGRASPPHTVGVQQALEGPGKSQGVGHKGCPLPPVRLLHTQPQVATHTLQPHLHTGSQIHLGALTSRRSQHLWRGVKNGGPRAWWGG